MSELVQGARCKPSRFNAMTWGGSGDLIIYNSMRGSVYRITDPAGEKVHGMLHNRTAVIARPPDGTDDRKIFDSLVSRGFLVDEQRDEMADAAEVTAARKHRTDVLELIIMPTEACNFRCTYCYEDFALGRMVSRVREGIRELVRNYHREHGIERLAVSWFGGEPLVAFEVIEELSEFFLEFCADHGIAYESRITTNGYLLTEDVARRCLDLSIRQYQITMDGPRETHDASRYLMGGGATYDEILANLRALSGLDGDFRVTMRTNFTYENSDRVPELIAELSEALSHDARFGVVYRPVGSWGGPQDEETGAHAGKGAELTKLDLCVQAADHGLPVLDRGLLRPSGSVCYAASPWSFVIRPNGVVNKCTVALRDPRNMVGLLDETGDLHLNDENMRLWTDTDDSSDTGCQSCYFRPSCQGAACPLVRLEENTRPCPPNKVWIGPTIQTYAALARRGAGTA